MNIPDFRFSVCLASVAAALAASAVQTVPASGSWAGVTPKLSADGRRWELVGAGGETLGLLVGEPWQADVSSVRVEVVGDRLSVDPSAVFASGAVRKLQLTGFALDRADLCGNDCTLKADVEGAPGTECTLFFEGRTAEDRHFYKYSGIPLRGVRTTPGMIQWIPKGLKELHVRFDIERFKGPSPLFVGAFRVGTLAELPLVAPKPRAKGELVFHLPFDGSAEAAVGKGDRRPVVERNLQYVPGKRGKAARFGSALGSRLEYALKDNLDPERGTVAMWVKREWDFSAAKTPWQSMFSFAHPTGGENRNGSGALWFWWYDGQLRADMSDPRDNYRMFLPPRDGRWMHVAFSWGDEGVTLYVNGRRRGNVDDSASPMVEALRSVERMTMDRARFKSFFVGNRSGFETFNGLIDDLRVYSAPLADAEIESLWRELAAPGETDPLPDYAALFKDDPPNRFVGAPTGKGGVPGKMTLVEELRFDATPGADRFKAVGATAVKSFGGVRYLEAGPNEGDRFAVRFTLPYDPAHPLYCLEIDYPDDAVRTADVIVQPATGGDYAMACGYAAGGEYPNTGRVLTHRCVYWASAKDVALVFMTARANASAAVSAVRVFKLDGDALPAAAVAAPSAKDGWRRSFALYFEDPSLNYEFGLDEAEVVTPEGVGRLADRVAAGMKYAGQDLLAYPGAWYHGLIGETYNPRNHAPDFLSAFYEKFDREGLFLMPTLNVNNMPVARGLVTRATMSDGSLHSSPIAIHDTGRPNWGRWHDTPPNFNIDHPEVQAYVEGIVDALVAQGVKHPSFRGVCLHLTRHCLLWFGDEESGYNDYTVDAFAKAKGLKIPVDRKDPMRGAAYAAWIRANCREEWIRWRCGRVTAFYAKLAAKLRAARPDLKLWLNSFAPADVNRPDSGRADYMHLANLRCGLDAAALTKAIPNLILCQSMVPADYRHRPASAYADPSARERQRDLDRTPGFYDLLSGAAYPWVNQHDRYWETAIGSNGALNFAGFREMGWRVTTINPSGRHALRHFAGPLRFTDVLGMSKGGFLIGTYGMEEELVPFVRAFRALPAVVMKDVAGTPSGDVRMRQADFAGRSYFYLVNAGEEPAEAHVSFPKGTVDLVSGRAETGGTVKLRPYELRAYTAPKGAPGWR